MSNLIYEKCLTLFSCNDDNLEKKIYNDILSEINNCLKTGKDSFLVEAINLAETQNKVAIFNQINQMINLSVTTIKHSNSDSHFFVFPIILQSPVTNLTLPGIKEFEKVLRINFQKYQFTTLPGNAINLAPVILGRKAVLSMNMTDWHKIHRATQSTLDKRNLRAMYEQPFSIQIDKDNASFQMFFLAFTVTTAPNEVPEFLNPLNINQDDIFSILGDIERFLQRCVPGTDWAVLPFGTINETVSNAFDFYQALLCENIISQHSQNFNYHFVLVPTNEQTSFALMVWNKETNNIVSALILNPYSKSLSDLVSEVLDLLNKYYIEALYIGDQELSSDKLADLNKIDFASYLRKYGASVLKSE